MFTILGTFINFGSDFATTTLGYMGTLISDLSPYLTLVIGVLILAIIVRVLIRIF